MPQKISISDDKIKELIKPDLDRAKARQDELRDERRKLLLLYSMSKEADGIRELNKPGFSQVVSSVCFESVEGMKVGLDQLFTSPDFFSVKIGDDKDAGERIRKLLRWNIFEAQYGARELRTWLHTTLLNHYGVLKVTWEEEYKEETAEFESVPIQARQQLEAQGWTLTKYEEVYEQIQVFDEFGIPVLQEILVEMQNVKATRKIPVFIGPRLKCIDPETFFYSPDAYELDRCRVVAQRIERRLDDIKRGEMEGRYKKGSYSKVKDISGEPTEPDGQDTRLSAIGISDQLSNDDNLGGERYTEPQRKVVIWEIYTSIDIDNDGLLEPVIVHMAGTDLDNAVVLNIVENPYGRPPFRLSRAIEAPFVLEGKPYLQSIQQDQVELTAMTRMWNDATAMSVYGNVVTNKVDFADAWNNRSIGTAIISQSVPNDDNMKVIMPPSPNPAILQAIEAKESAVERKSGVTRHSQGISADSLNKTATGMSIINSNTMAKQKYTASVMSETYEDVLEDMVACFKLFGEPYIQYFTGKGNEINPADYQSDFTIEITLGVGPQERMQKAAFLKEALQFAVSVGIPSGFQGIEHAAQIYDAIGELVDVPMSQYHYSAEEMQQREQQKQLAMQQQQMMMQAAQQGAIQNDPRAAQAPVQQEAQAPGAIPLGFGG